MIKLNSSIKILITKALKIEGKGQMLKTEDSIKK